MALPPLDVDVTPAVILRTDVSPLGSMVVLRQCVCGHRFAFGGPMLVWFHPVPRNARALARTTCCHRDLFIEPASDDRDDIRVYERVRSLAANPEPPAEDIGGIEEQGLSLPWHWYPWICGHPLRIEFDVFRGGAEVFLEREGGALWQVWIRPLWWEFGVLREVNPSRLSIGLGPVVVRRTRSEAA